MDREKLYDLIYAKANKLLETYNPCGIHVNENGLVSCNNSRYNNTEELCCYQCKYVGIDGCTIKCLACKLCMCVIWDREHIDKMAFDKGCHIVNAPDTFRAKMYKLIRVANRYNLIKIHSSKESMFAETLEQGVNYGR